MAKSLCNPPPNMPEQTRSHPRISCSQALFYRPNPYLAGMAHDIVVVWHERIIWHASEREAYERDVRLKEY
jgi:hypothetical protein